MRDQPHHVVQRDPGHPLPAGADRAAEPVLELRQQPRQHAAFGAEHEADAQPHHAHAEPLGLHRGALPVGADALSERGPPARRLGQALVVALAVPADRRGAHQHGGLDLQPPDQAHDIAGHAQARGEDAVALGDGPQAVCDRLAREVDDRVDVRLVGKLREPGDQPERRGQCRGARRIARQHDHVVARAIERLHQPAPDEAGRPGDQEGLPAGKRHDQVLGRRDERVRAARGEQVARAEDCRAERCKHHQGAPRPVRRELYRGAFASPRDQHRHREHQDGAVVDREQCVVDAFARGQLAAHVLLDEVGERDEHLDGERRHHQHGEQPVHLKEAEHEEQHRVDEAARRMQGQLVALRRAPREPLGQLVVIDGVESRHRDLDGDEGPKHRGHGCASWKAAVWQMSRPSRGWMRSSLNRKRPSPSSACVTLSAPGEAQRGKRMRQGPTCKK